MLIIVTSFFSCKTKKNSLEVTISKEVNYIPYYLKVYEADSLFVTNNYKKSYEILDSLFQIYEPINMENYYEYGNYIASSVMSGHTEGIYKKIEKGYLKFGKIGVLHKNSYELLDSVYKVASLTNEDRLRLKSEYLKTINLDLRKKIQIMEEEDQSVRQNYDEVKINYFREKHKIELDDIISKYGYPNYQVIGPMGYLEEEPVPFTVKVMFLHQDTIFQKKHLPLLLENLKKGKSLPDDYTSIFDKVIWVRTEDKKTNKHKQLYGTFPNVDLMNPKKIDSIRTSIGLPHIKYLMWRHNNIF